MYWLKERLSTASPEEVVLILEDLLDEDEIIEQYKTLNPHLINFLKERTQIEQLIRYTVEDAPQEADIKRCLKFPFVACEIFTCKVDIILKALADDEELMNLLFSFLEPRPSHRTLLAGHFSKVVTSLMLRKRIPFMQYLQAHQAIIKKLVDLIGIPSILEVLVMVLRADKHLYFSHMKVDRLDSFFYTESMKWIEEIDVLEMILEKFSSSDNSKVHSNAADALCAIVEFSPTSLLAKIYSRSFVGRLFHYTLEDSRPTSVLLNSLTVCIFFLTTGTFHGSETMEVVEGMLESLGRLVKLLDDSSSKKVLDTTYGKLKPPLGQKRLKIVEFVSILLTVGSRAAEELINHGAIKRILELFFEYPFNNFLHHHVEKIVVSCLKSNNSSLVEHLLHECNLVGKILDAEKHSTFTVDVNKPTVSTEGRAPPRAGNRGHLTRISNKLIQLASSSSEIRSHLQENTEWNDWKTNVLSKRNATESIYQWESGRPTALQDQTTDSSEDDHQDIDDDVAALENKNIQPFPHGIFNNKDIEEDVLKGDEDAEAIVSSLNLDDDNESFSLFAIDPSRGLFASTSSNFKETGAVNDDNVTSDSKEIVSEVTEPDATEPAVGQVPAPTTNEETVNDVTIGDKSSKDPGN